MSGRLGLGSKVSPKVSVPVWWLRARPGNPIYGVDGGERDVLWHVIMPSVVGSETFATAGVATPVALSDWPIVPSLTSTRRGSQLARPGHLSQSSCVLCSRDSGGWCRTVGGAVQAFAEPVADGPGVVADAALVTRRAGIVVARVRLRRLAEPLARPPPDTRRCSRRARLRSDPVAASPAADRSGSVRPDRIDLALL